MTCKSYNFINLYSKNKSAKKRLVGEIKKLLKHCGLFFKHTWSYMSPIFLIWLLSCSHFTKLLIHLHEIAYYHRRGLASLEGGLSFPRNMRAWMSKENKWPRWETHGCKWKICTGEWLRHPETCSKSVSSKTRGWEIPSIILRRYVSSTGI